MYVSLPASRLSQSLAAQWPSDLRDILLPGAIRLWLLSTFFATCTLKLGVNTTKKLFVEDSMERIFLFRRLMACIQNEHFYWEPFVPGLADRDESALCSRQCRIPQSGARSSGMNKSKFLFSGGGLKHSAWEGVWGRGVVRGGRGAPIMRGAINIRGRRWQPGGSCERRPSDERSATTDGTWDYNLYLLSPQGCHWPSSSAGQP